MVVCSASGVRPPPPLPEMAPGAAERALSEVDALRTPPVRRRPGRRRPPESPLRTWGVVIAVATAVFLSLLALLYVVSLFVTSRPTL